MLTTIKFASLAIALHNAAAFVPTATLPPSVQHTSSPTFARGGALNVVQEGIITIMPGETYRENLPGHAYWAVVTEGNPIYGTDEDPWQGLEMKNYYGGDEPAFSFKPVLGTQSDARCVFYFLVGDTQNDEIEITNNYNFPAQVSIKEAQMPEEMDSQDAGSGIYYVKGDLAASEQVSFWSRDCGVGNTQVVRSGVGTRKEVGGILEPHRNFDYKAAALGYWDVASTEWTFGGGGSPFTVRYGLGPPEM